MKLDRNLPGNEGRGKYALLKLRELKRRLDDPTITEHHRNEVRDSIVLLEDVGVLDYGPGPGTEDDFFVIRLKDIGAAPALMAYARAYTDMDNEFAAEVSALGVAASKLKGQVAT